MKRISFDRDWRFKLGDPTAWRWVTHDVSTWRSVDLPHDWSIELERRPENLSGSTGGYFTMGVGHYHKTFTAPEEWRGKRVLIEFEGVYMNAEVSLNGNYLGRHPYGYTSFVFDLSPYLKIGEENKLLVTVDNAAQRNSRWYSGSGIYRHVWLWVAGPVHIGHWGVYVTTPEVTREGAAVHVETTIANVGAEPCAATLRTRVLAPDGTAVSEDAARVEGGGEVTIAQTLEVRAPKLWSLSSPVLYQLDSQLIVDGAVVDTAVTPFGIRTLSFSAAEGFLLNGEPTLLKGGCVHHDNGVLGAAAYDRSEERKVEVHKASGYNAIRCAHNPPSPAFLDACDRLGMLVIDESFDCWRQGKTAYDYHVSFDDWWGRDLDAMLYRDRNHPSIILWSIGNEVGERNGNSDGAEIAAMLVDYVRSVDPTRPITSAINGGHTAWPWEQTDAVFDLLGVGGYNYAQKEYKPDHERKPARIMMGTESVAREAFEHWMDVLSYPWVIGDFVWTSLDYLGESGIGRVVYESMPFEFLGAYPWHQANCGDLDLCGFKRPQSYYRDVLWGERDLYIAVHTPVPEGKTPTLTYWGWPDADANWTWPGCEGKTFTVHVYSACDAVELFLNGVSLGKQPTTREQRFTASFAVPYAAGELAAVGYRNGEPAARCGLQTAGAPSAIHLTPDRAQLNALYGDLSFVTVEVVDANGQMHPGADHSIYFTVQGPAAVAAVGNANPTSEESYCGNTRRAYHGRCLVVVKASGEAGEVILRAQADGLAPAEIALKIG